MAFGTGEVQGLFARETAVICKAGNQSFQLRYGLQANVITPYGGIFADDRNQVNEFGVQSMLKKRGARRGAAGANIATIQYECVNAFLRQMVRRQRSRDAGADDRDLARRIVAKRGVRSEDA